MGIEPANCKALYRIALAHTNISEYEKAEIYLHKALIKEPKNEELSLLKQKIISEKKEQTDKIREVSKKAFASSKEKKQVSVMTLFGLFWSILKLIKEIILDFAWKFVGPILDYALSFWIVRTSVKVFIIFPYKIGQRLTSFALSLFYRIFKQKTN